MEDHPDLEPLAPAYRRLLMLRGAVFGAVLIGAALFAARFAPVPGWLPLGTGLIVAVYAALISPLRAYRHAGWSDSGNQLRVVGGVLFRSDTVVPYSRVQHIDIDQSPLARLMGLSELTVHTAGKHNASVTLPGLSPETAEDLRRTIREHIRRSEG